MYFTIFIYEGKYLFIMTEHCEVLNEVTLFVAPQQKHSEYFLIKHLYSEAMKEISTDNRFIFRMFKCLNRCSIIQ